MVHEVSNYLGIILGSSELALLEPGLGADSVETLEAIGRATLRCKRLLELLRGLGRSDTEGPELLSVCLAQVRLVSHKYLFLQGLSVVVAEEDLEPGEEPARIEEGGQLVLCVLALLTAQLESIRDREASGILQLAIRRGARRLWVEGRFLELEPSDAEVRPQGRFLGLARELAEEAGWMLDPGSRGFLLHLNPQGLA